MAEYNNKIAESNKVCNLCECNIEKGEEYFESDIDDGIEVCDRCQFLLEKKYNYRAGLKSFFEYLLSTDILRCEPCGSNSVEITKWSKNEVEVFCTICNYIYNVDISKENLIEFMEKKSYIAY
ncbi:MAG: hypothetical protein Q4P31_06865 [Andreesenia angusta]|nr:hypothetical protein [Andreesenia angusta]